PPAHGRVPRHPRRSPLRAQARGAGPRPAAAAPHRGRRRGLGPPRRYRRRRSGARVRGRPPRSRAGAALRPGHAPLNAGRLAAAALALLASGCGGGMTDPSAADALRVVGMSPAPRTVTAAPEGAITIRFDRALRPDAIVNGGTLHVFARWSGTV